MNLLAVISQPMSPWAAGILAFFALGFAMFAIVAGVLGQEKAKNNLKTLGAKLGFADNPKVSIPTIRRTRDMALSSVGSLFGKSEETGIEGVVRGRKVRFAEFATSTGRASVSWAELAVSTEAGAFSFALYPDMFGNGMFHWLGGPDLNVGDPEFDPKWRVMTRSEATMRVFLSPDIRAEINRVNQRGNSYYMCENGWLRYKERGDYASQNRIDRYSGMLDSMIKLAAAVEAAAKQSPLQPPSLPNYAQGYDNDKNDDWGVKSQKWRVD